ncbi:endonuclease/exonuclease/phosphatase family protein [Neptunicella sp. SCSIO 80796]|uniref:endonuclease/exonuclease/phosphatase family protein n=1 Tax=Neptunicella plasticusilytica TaxID=3117012 RepID=UPI003A4E0958
MILRLFFLMVVAVSQLTQAEQIRVATFNVSMEATNYVERDQPVNGDELFELLATGDNQQIKNIAAIIQRVRPDIILLNEFDYTPDPDKGVKAFIHNYLNIAQQGSEAIDFPYFYVAPVNTGVDSGVDLDRDGQKTGVKGDAFGFGFYPGHFGMVLLSRFPIDGDDVRTFQHFLWKDMPDNLMVKTVDAEGQPWYLPETQKVMRLSSKSHWDVPVKVQGKTIHILASHPTPPVFDGPEDRNGKRNHDEVRFWVDYLGSDYDASYIYDDNGQKGGFNDQRFVLLGDLNSSMAEGDSFKTAIASLLTHTRVNGRAIPHSQGGQQHTPDNPLAGTHTAGWRMRADYVLPSEKGFKVIGSGIFWPTTDEPDYALIKDRNSSSDHRLVWLDLEIK